MLQQQLEMTLDKLSNDEFDGLTIDDAWIEEAGEGSKRPFASGLLLKRRFSLEDV